MSQVSSKASSKFSNVMLVLALLVSLQACKNDVIYAESQAVPRDGWGMKDTLVFSPVFEKTDIAHDLQLWVRHSKEYKYSNLWLKVESELDLNGEDDLYEIKLADKNGKWLGTCSQSMCTARLILKSSITQEETKAYQLSVVQYMREQSLPHIKDVGVELVLSKTEAVDQ